jgi:N-acetylneuraminic acid mutarotase
MERGARSYVLILVIVTLMFFSACGGASGVIPSPPQPPTTYTIGGTVSGLSGTGLVLQDNGASNLQVGANGSFTFATSIVSGKPYNVTILQQPSSPVQSCVVTNGSGTAVANVANVQIACTTVTYTIGGTVVNLVPDSGLVLQDNGGDSLTLSANGSFQFATPLNSGASYSVTILAQPSSPAQICTLANGSGTALANVMNISLDCGHNEWTWVTGTQTINQIGTYGTLGVPAAANTPGGRQSPATWTDASGNFWLFGGYGYDSAHNLLPFNDLWKFNAGQWAWMGGPSLAGGGANYGTMGVASTTNIPGARTYGASWTDAAGDLWLFGGNGFDSAGKERSLNDLWKYSAGQWTWVGGSNVGSQNGNYGLLGVAAPSNFPGARDSAMTWVDASGTAWLFGGLGYDSSSTIAVELSDLWKYSGGQWTWVSGPKVGNQPGVYGTEGLAAANNIPGARFGAYSWTDASGNLWLFGGVGYDSNGLSSLLNDVWEYSAGEWTWESGSKVGNQPGVYGTQGIAAANNVPGAREYGVSWTDSSGNGWLFGGAGYYSASQVGELNDLWKFSNGQWTWMAGSKIGNLNSVFGIQGAPAPGNTPGGRDFLSRWVDAQGNLWLFGGWGLSTSGTGNLNDLWKYEP